MKKNLKNLLIGTGILAMVLTPAAMISSIYNDEIEPAALSTTEKTTPAIDFAPQYIDYEIKHEGRQTINASGLDFYSEEFGGFELNTSRPDAIWTVDSQLTGEGEYVPVEPWEYRERVIMEDADLEIEFNFQDGYGIDFGNAEITDGTNYEYLDMNYIPNEVIDGGDAEVYKYIARTEVSEYPNYGESIFATMEDGRASFALHTGDPSTYRPVILNLTWEDEYNMPKNKDAYDLYYEDLDEDNYTSTIKFQSKKREWFEENNIIKKRGYMERHASVSTEFNVNEGDFISISTQDFWWFKLMTGTPNLITNISEVTTFDLLSKSMVSYLNTDDLNYYYYIKINEGEDWTEVVTSKLTNYYEENFNIKQIDDSGVVKFKFTPKNDTMFYPDEKNNDSIQFVPGENDDSYYIGLPFRFQYDNQWHYEYISSSNYNKSKEYIEKYISEEQFVQINENVQVTFELIRQKYFNDPFDNPFLEYYMDQTDYKFVQLTDVNGNVRNHILTSGEIALIMTTILVLILLLVIIVFWIKNSTVEDNNINIISKKEGGN